MDIRKHAGNSYILRSSVCLPVSTGALKGDQSLKMPSDSISESVIFQNFLGACPQIPLVLAYFAYPCALHTMTVHIPASPHINMMISLAVPPFSKVSICP